MLSGLGSAFHSTAMANPGNRLTSNIAVVWLSVAVMLIVAALSLFSVRIVARIIFWLIVVQVLAFVVLIGMLAANSHADFTSALATYSNHGDSDWPGAYSFQLMCDDVVAVLDRLDLAPITLIGHSMGGTVALLAALQQPERVARLVVEDATPPYPRHRAVPDRPEGRWTSTGRSCRSSLRWCLPGLGARTSPGAG
jgi:hypothetical protein